MLIIKSVEVIEVKQDPVLLLANTPPNSRVFIGAGQRPVEQELFSELIRGRQFRRPSDNMDIIVGVTGDAGKILGLMYEAWDDLEKCYKDERKRHDGTMLELIGYRIKVKDIKNASFWKRLKWLFTGYK